VVVEFDRYLGAEPKLSEHQLRELEQYLENPLSSQHLDGI